MAPGSVGSDLTPAAWPSSPFEADLSRGLYSGNEVFSGLVLGLRGRGGRRRVRAGASGNTHQSELSRERLAGPPPPPSQRSSQEPRQRVRAPLSSPSDSEAPSETSLLRVSTKVKVRGPQVPPEGRAAPGLQAHPGTRTSPRLTLGPRGSHRPAEICPSTAGPPQLVRAARPVPAHRASSPQPDRRRSAGLKAWTRPCLCQRLPGPLHALPSRSHGGVWMGEGLPSPAPCLGGSHPTSERGGCSQEPGWSPQRERRGEGRPCSLPAEPPEAQRASWAPPELETARFSQALSET